MAVASSPAGPRAEREARWATWRLFWPYLRPQRRRLAVSAALVVLGPALDAATLYVYKLAVDRVLVPRDLHAFVWVAGLFAGLTAAASLASFADDYVATKIGERFILELRTHVFDHLQRLDPDFFERRQLGDLLSRLTGDTGAIETLMLSAAGDGLAYALRILFFGAALVLLSPPLALIALAVLPATAIVSRTLSRRIKGASREKRARVGALTAAAEQALSNAPLVQAYGAEARETARLRAQAGAAMRAELRATRLRGALSGGMDAIQLMGAVAILRLGTLQLSHGALTLGGLVAFMAYLSQLYSPVRRLGRLATTIFSAAASAERIAELLRREPTVCDRPGALRRARPRGAVAFEAVSFAYPGTRRGALDDVSLRLEPGEVVAVVGPSGAGKSTLVKLLLRFYDPDAGRVTLDGYDLRDLALADVRAATALLLQEALLFDDTVAENARYGTRGASAEAFATAARVAGLDQTVRALSDGYDTGVGQRGRRLSGGQRQRVAIARALLRDAPILILDEPTTGLDADSIHALRKPLRELMRDRTTLLISHSAEMAAEADRIVVLEGGRVSEAEPVGV